LVEAVQDYAIFMLDPKGHIVSWNTGAERIKGYRAKEIIGKHFSCFYPCHALLREGSGWSKRLSTSEV
jgi:PAS domain S-box-containing protein